MKKSIITKIAVTISFFLASGNSLARLSIPKMPTPLKTIIFSKKSAATAAALAALTIFDRTILERTPLFNSLAESAVKRYVQNDTNKSKYQYWLYNFLADTISWGKLYFDFNPPQIYQVYDENTMSYTYLREKTQKLYPAKKIELSGLDTVHATLANALGNIGSYLAEDVSHKPVFNAIIYTMSAHISQNWKTYKKTVLPYVQHLKSNGDMFYITLNPNTNDQIMNTFAVPGYNLFGIIVSAIYWATDKNNPERIFAKQARFRWRIYRELLAKMIGHSYKEPEAPVAGGD